MRKGAISGWNNRVVKTENGFKIVEAYYDKKGRISGWCDSCYEREAETVQGLVSDLTYLLLACSKPVVEKQGDYLVEHGR